MLFLLSASEEGDKLKLWDADNKLTWADFQAKPPSEPSSRAAMTNSTIRLNFEQVTDKTFTINVISAMDPERSWVYPERKSDYILTHEQYHFNITEYYARHMRKDLSMAKYNLKNIQDKIKSIEHDNISALKEMQDQYDADSKHSINKEGQQQWQDKVDKLLKSLDEYTNPTVTVMIK